MTKREKLEALRKENMRERAEVRENEMYTREGEEFTIQMIRDKMARVLNDAEMEPETRKERLAVFRDEIEAILDARDEREHVFIEHELKMHQKEQELEAEIAAEEAKDGTEPAGGSLNIKFQARSSLTAGAELLRKDIEEKRKELNEEEQFSTILINSSERDNIPTFVRKRRRKTEEKKQEVRIDTIALKQREIGMMYRESYEQQKLQLGKAVEKGEKDAPTE